MWVKVCAASSRGTIWCGHTGRGLMWVKVCVASQSVRSQQQGHHLVDIQVVD